MRRRIVTQRINNRVYPPSAKALADNGPGRRNGLMPSLLPYMIVMATALFIPAQAKAEVVLGLGGYTQARLTNTENTDARLNTDIGLSGNAGWRWQSGSRSLNAGYALTTRASAGSWLDPDTIEGQLDQQITGSTRFSQQARNNLWDLSVGHQATLYNPSQGLTINPFDLDVRQGLSANAGLNLQPASRTRVRLGVNAGTSIDADFNDAGSTLGWAASATRQLKPRTSGTLTLSQTAAYSPEGGDPAVISNVQLSLNRVLQNGSVSGAVGVSQSEQGNVSTEAVTGSLARRWQWSQHQGELSANRAISSTLFDLTTLTPEASGGASPSGSAAETLAPETLAPETLAAETLAAETPADSVESISLVDSISLRLSTQRWCSLCTNNLTLSGSRAQQLSDSVPGVADEQYSASVGTGMTLRVSPAESVNLTYQWQGDGLGQDEQFQQRNQISGGWQRALDRRLSVSGLAQVQWLTGRNIDNRNEWLLRASATYQLGSVQ